MSSRRSPIHDYFRDDGVGKRCNSCDKYFAGTNSSWIKHLEKTHKPEYRVYQRRAADLAQQQQLSQPVRSPSISSTVSAASSYAVPALPLVTSSASTVSSSSPVVVLDSSPDIEPRTIFSRKRPRSQSSFSLGPSMKQTSIVELMNRGQEQDLYTSLAQFFVLLQLPWSHIENNDFISMIATIRNSHISLPSSFIMKKHCAEAYYQMKKKVIKKMKGIRTYVTIAIDGWTNVRHDKVINVLPICQGTAYYWSSAVNPLHNNSAENQYTILAPIIKDLIDHRVTIVGLVADNEAVNGALFKLLQKEYSFLIQIPCAAHTIQLCVKKMLELPAMKVVIDGMSTILNIFERKKELRLQLKNVQIASKTTSKAKVYSLVKPCDTRWSSSLRAAQRMLSLRDSINTVIRQSDVFWDSLTCLCDFLLPFQIATDIIQRDSSSLYEVYYQFTVLLDHIRMVNVASPFFDAQIPASQIIVDQWKKNINESAVICCALFSFDDNYKTVFSREARSSATEWFFSFGANFLMFYGMTSEDTTAAVHCLIKDQYGSFQDRSGGFAGIDAYVIESRRRQIKANLIVQSDDSDAASHSWWNPKVVWSQYLESNEELCACVMALLSMTSSEAAVERSFSLQDQVHSKRRNRLADAQVEKEMFIRFNTQAMRSERKPSGAWVELDDNYQPVANPSEFAPLVRATVINNPDAVSVEAADPLLALVLPAEDDSSVIQADVLSSSISSYALLEAVFEEKGNDEPHSEEQSEIESSLSQASEMQVDESALDVFIHSFIVRYKIGPNTKFNSDRSNALMQEIISAGIRIPERDLKEMIIAVARSM